MKKTKGIKLLMLALAAVAISSCGQQNDTKMEAQPHYTFAQSEQVSRQQITFKNRYGITLVADLYIPKAHAAGKFAAIAVSGPFGAVKEQSSGLYA